MPEKASTEASRGVLSTNRPPAISHTENIQNTNIPLGSEDTAVLSLYVYWKEDFDELKVAAQTGDHEKDHLNLNNQIYLFKPIGYKSGTGTGPMYRWAIECEGVRISIANQHEPKKEIPTWPVLQLV